MEKGSGNDWTGLTANIFNMAFKRTLRMPKLMKT